MGRFLVKMPYFEYNYQVHKICILFEIMYFQGEFMSKTYHIINYGCQMNESDSEHFAGQLADLGYRYAEDFHVAQLAGLPKKVVERAEDLLLEYDGEKTLAKKPAEPIVKDVTAEQSLFSGGVVKRIINMDIMTMEEDIKLFLEYLTVELGLAQNTKDAYERDLKLFATKVKKSIKTITRQDVIAYMYFLKKERYAPSSMARKLAALKSFFRFMTAEGYLEIDPAEVIEAGNKGTILPRVLNRQDVLKLLETPDEATDEGFRDRTMLEVLYATGMRVSELINMPVAGVNLQMKYVIAFGKGSKERIIPLGHYAVEYLEKYLNVVRPRLLHVHYLSF